ncbi:MAG: 4Fe-4S dicluster domain-containing protein [Abitibacteriaceae bacterium]|nr:4Fe-4S dicluster domain-containing protein [Abditibacteriaceae bacterium]MBV9864721.1 4Fe-4S dicluster domain-containing protein [Abditibacteriaceae bacterium]
MILQQLPVLNELSNAFPPRQTPVPSPGSDTQPLMGFFTDTSVCIGCKACEVACKQWNQLPSDGFNFTGHSYDNTRMLSETTWRHVAFKEKIGGEKSRWLMMSDVCKHCEDAPCQQSCPTGSIIYNEFGDVYVQPDICNGCGYCISACPFGVLGRSPEDGRAHKCTLCYDRQTDGMQPACAKSCPTASIQFGPVEELREKAKQRVETLHAQGNTQAYLYGADSLDGYGRLNSFFLLEDHPNEYNLPEAPPQPLHGQETRYALSLLTGLVLMLLSALFFSKGDNYAR